MCTLHRGRDGDRMYTPRRDHDGGDRMYTPRHGHDDDAHDRDDAQIILRFLHHAQERDGLRLHSTDPTVWK